MEKDPFLEYKVCYRDTGSCLYTLGTTIEQVDEWVEAKRAEGHDVTKMGSCQSICNKIGAPNAQIEDGVTGVTVSGTLPNGDIAVNMPAIAVTVNGIHKSRKIKS